MEVMLPVAGGTMERANHQSRSTTSTGMLLVEEGKEEVC